MTNERKETISMDIVKRTFYACKMPIELLDNEELGLRRLVEEECEKIGISVMTFLEMAFMKAKA